jgi:spore coat protein CotF
MNVNELGFLWYLQSSSNMINLLLKYLSETSEDTDLRNIVNEIYEFSTFQEQEATQLLSEEGYKDTPFFMEDDIYSSTTKLFSDQLIIEILKHITSNGLRVLAVQYVDLTDYKVKNFYKKLLNDVIQLDFSLLKLLNDKDLLQNNSFSYKKADERDGKLFKVTSTQQRPLNAVELANMFSSLQCNNVGVALCIGFSEVVEDMDTKKFILEGKKLAFYQSASLSDIYRENGIPTTTGLEAHVNKVKESPFSDKLMANLIMFLNPVSISNLQNAVVSSYKKDHIDSLKELIKMVEDYSEKGLKLLIRKNWFNEPPVSNWSHK